MQQFRKYGSEPFHTAIIHGGPGAPGEMAPVARELVSIGGVLEPLQVAVTLEGQVGELKAILEKEATLPVTLIGFSWGAMLSFIVAAKHPSLVKKLILISSGPYEEKYTIAIMKIRLGRLGEKEKREAVSLMRVLEDPAVKGNDSLLVQLAKLMAGADSYDPVPHESEVLKYQYDVYQGVWRGANRLRSSGELLELGRKIDCPVVAIHGDYDSHPAAGVEETLSGVLKEFQFILLQKCGHYPWWEKEVRDTFYEVLKKEIRGN
jgi:pimeloyl-ACP methyl ester carboxylesterase